MSIRIYPAVWPTIRTCHLHLGGPSHRLPPPLGIIQLPAIAMPSAAALRLRLAKDSAGESRSSSSSSPSSSPKCADSSEASDMSATAVPWLPSWLRPPNEQFTLSFVHFLLSLLEYGSPSPPILSNICGYKLPISAYLPFIYSMYSRPSFCAVIFPL